MNSCQLVGRLTKDPEIKTYGQDGKIAKFSVAINRGKNAKGEDLGADYPNITVFGKRAEVIEKYFHKGSMIAIVGHIHTDSYEKDGKKYYTTDVVMDSFDFVDSKKEDNPEKMDNPFDVVSGFQKIDAESIPF